MLARGTKAAGFDLIRFLTISGHAFNHQDINSYLFLKPKISVDHHPQIPNSGSVISLKISLFWSLFSRPKKSEKRLQRLPKSDENRSRNSLKRISLKSRFLQCVPCENLDLEVPSVEISIQKSITRWPGTKPEQKINMTFFFEFNKLIHTGTKISLKSNKIM